MVPPLSDTYQAAVRDYNSAHYEVAAASFRMCCTTTRNDDLAGNAQFFLGEMSIGTVELL